eukprot:gene12275-biopygen9900
MAAGDNTLNAQCARVVIRQLANDGGEYSKGRSEADFPAFEASAGSLPDAPCRRPAVAAAYVEFMTTPGGGWEQAAEPAAETGRVARAPCRFRPAPGHAQRQLRGGVPPAVLRELLRRRRGGGERRGREPRHA